MKALSQLNYEDLRRCAAWVAVGDYAEVEDPELAPVGFDSDGRVPRHIEEVWCLSRATFADGSEHPAIAMCRGDSDAGPLLWSVWNGTEDVPVVIPPAPSSVLAKRGPGAFASKFGRAVEDVFPMDFEVIAGFSTYPLRRRVKIEATGIAKSP